MSITSATQQIQRTGLAYHKLKNNKGDQDG